MASQVRVIMLKENMPTVEEARARLNAEIDKASGTGIRALKLIHGYGASGAGGSLRTAIRRSLHRRQKEGRIQGFVTGEQWAMSEPTAAALLDACPELRRDSDLNRYNEGVTFVLL